MFGFKLYNRLDRRQINIKKRFKYFLVLIVGSIIALLIIYKISIYTPPLLDSGKRNFAEKTIDFLSFGWHFTKASIFKDYLKNKSYAERELGKAGWYRKKYLIKYFKVNGKDLNSVSALYKLLKLNSISEKLDAFIKKERNE